LMNPLHLRYLQGCDEPYSSSGTKPARLSCMSEHAPKAEKQAKQLEIGRHTQHH